MQTTFNAPLLIELLTEEMPARSLKLLSEQFGQTVFNSLKNLAFLDDAHSQLNCYATPRRLALHISHVQAIQPKRQIERKGPSVKANQNAIDGFARSCGVSVAELTTRTDEKANTEYYYFVSEKEGEALSVHLESIVQEALKKLPIPKMMRWGDSTVQFVRPVHSLIFLHGDHVVSGEVLGLKADQKTRGHRFLAVNSQIKINHADNYVYLLETVGHVIPSYEKRKGLILKQLNEQAHKAQATLPEYESLLEEVTGLVEYPVVYQGQFDEAFLRVPQECLMLSMRQHQKYFPMLDQNGKLLPQFLVVSNLRTFDPSAIIHGNERVLRARLSDARFFFEQDQKAPLANRLDKLAHVVYHNKLGSQADRMARVRTIASNIAKTLNIEPALVERAAALAKADLLTDMVGEFPELQGIMGRYYALNDGENPRVATAIEQHYYPRFAGDRLPEDIIGVSVALADKLETLVGIYGIGLIPTGEKDPFGLRRCALGILRMLSELNLNLRVSTLLSIAYNTFANYKLTPKAELVEKIQHFMTDRFKFYLRDQGFLNDETEAVLGIDHDLICLVKARLQAVQSFKQLPEAQSLAAANKRIQNILKKNTEELETLRFELLSDPAEQQLYQAILQVKPEIDTAIKTQVYNTALNRLAGMRIIVDRFFDEVMVNVDNKDLRLNRLSLLKSLADLMNQVADISVLNI